MIGYLSRKIEGKRMGDERKQGLLNGNKRKIEHRIRMKILVGRKGAGTKHSIPPKEREEQKLPDAFHRMGWK